jgi:hypothetical protein
MFAWAIFLAACNDLNLNPLSTGSNATWYEDESEINMSLNDLYRIDFWAGDLEAWSDNWMARNALTPITDATINSEWGTSETYWQSAYKGIGRANALLANVNKASGSIPKAKLNRFISEAKFVRASHYSTLISHFGDAVYTEEPLDLETAYNLSRTDKKIILKKIYADYDSAAFYLPVSYGSGELKRATKGAALAMKARIALYMGDWVVARDAAKACMDLNVYQLYPDFSTLFKPSTKNSIESIFAIPRSIALGSYIVDGGYITRNAGGNSGSNPSWDLFCSFLCKDGLPIDKSPLFDPHQPFINRDPRCSATFVEFQTKHLGFMYQPHPDSLMCYNFNTGKYQKNNDTRSNTQYASFNGLVFKKGVDDSWLSSGNKVDPDKIIIRYADVMLIYAEAKIELNEIDQSVLNVINQVRARAYNVDYKSTLTYPAVITTNQEALRKILRIERRMEFANEGTRYMDLIRWKLAEKVLNKPNYGMLDPNDLREKVVKPGLWFFPQTPSIDEDGTADFSPMYNAGLIKLLTVRKFDPSKQYLWPIPAKELLINTNIKQNPGY